MKAKLTSFDDLSQFIPSNLANLWGLVYNNELIDFTCSSDSFLHTHIQLVTMNFSITATRIYYTSTSTTSGFSFQFIYNKDSTDCLGHRAGAFLNPLNSKTMNSIQTNSKNYVYLLPTSKCVTQIVAIAEPEGFRLYVAWEWEKPASKGVFGIAKSQTLYRDITFEAINETANQGFDISMTEEAKRIFNNLLS